MPQQLDPEEVDRWLAVITRDPERCRQFLLECGFIDENGDLAKPYRAEPEQPSGIAG
jgi:hypothetical protein